MDLAAQARSSYHLRNIIVGGEQGSIAGLFIKEYYTKGKEQKSNGKLVLKAKEVRGDKILAKKVDNPKSNGESKSFVANMKTQKKNLKVTRKDFKLKIETTNN